MKDFIETLGLLLFVVGVTLIIAGLIYLIWWGTPGDKLFRTGLVLGFFGFILNYKDWEGL